MGTLVGRVTPMFRLLLGLAKRHLKPPAPPQKCTAMGGRVEDAYRTGQKHSWGLLVHLAQCP